MTFKIGADAGHSLVTPGKETPDKEKEWSFNDVKIRAFIAEMKNYEDVEVYRYDNPTGKTDVPLKTRTDKANKDKVDVYISFHHNANTGKWGDWTGTETHVYKTKPKEAVKLAQAVQPKMAKAYGLKDRGIKYTNLHITRETDMTTILLEGGFMDSRIDIEKLRDDEVLRKAGRAVAQAVAEFYGLKRKKETPASKSGTDSGSDDKYSIAVNITGYKTADDAKKKKNKATTVTKGSYYIFNKSGGMINVSKKKGSPGSWINPADNKKPTTQYHTVKADETVWELSQKYKTTVQKIADLNNLKDPGSIYPGQKLRVK